MALRIELDLDAGAQLGKTGGWVRHHAVPQEGR